MRYSLSNRRAIDPFFTLRHLDSLLNENLARATSPAAWSPVVDLIETADAWRLVAELPGIAPEQVQLTIEGRVLTLAGEKTVPESAETPTRSERQFGAFARRFTLPESVNADQISASYEHGLVTITVPKAPQSKPRAITVQVTPQTN